MCGGNSKEAFLKQQLKSDARSKCVFIPTNSNFFKKEINFLQKEEDREEEG